MQLVMHADAYKKVMQRSETWSVHDSTRADVEGGVMLAAASEERLSEAQSVEERLATHHRITPLALSTPSDSRVPL